LYILTSPLAEPTTKAPFAPGVIVLNKGLVL